MPEKWTGRLIGEMHNHNVTYEELAAEPGVTKPYISMILNGARKPAGIRKRMEDAFKEVVRKKNGVTVDKLLSESRKEDETSETA